VQLDRLSFSLPRIGNGSVWAYKSYIPGAAAGIGVTPCGPFANAANRLVSHDITEIFFNSLQSLAFSNTRPMV
jgi:hypothetical protein